MKCTIHVVLFGIIGFLAGCGMSSPSSQPTAAEVATTRPPALIFSEPPPDGMVLIPAGTFWMGTDDGPEDERPCHQVRLNAFWIDKTEVTNAQFAEFVKATDYKTIAERAPDASKYPDAPKEKLVPFSAVFKCCEAHLDGVPTWWEFTPGADWRHPNGPNSTIKGKDNYPVVQMCWEDAAAYAKWAGKRLPTEAEWEYAARGGLDRKEYCWGDAKQGEGGKWWSNSFQGKFPAHDAGSDGFASLAPVAQYPANGYGLFDMSGNAWEWCQDWYQPDYYKHSPGTNPKGPATGIEEMPNEGALKVRRGGSFLCADNYCRRYLPASRDKNPADSAANHTGFRCVKDVK